MKSLLLNLEDKYPVTLFVALILLIAWPFILARGWALSDRLEEGILFYILVTLPIIISQFSPSIVASLFVYNRYGREGLVAFWRRGIQRPDNDLWLGVAIILPIIIVSVAVIFLIWAGFVPAPPLMKVLTACGFYLLALLVGLLIGGISEEYGWRGYLLPILQHKHTALIASIIVAIWWSIWHLSPDVIAVYFNDGWGAFASALGVDYGKRIFDLLASCIIYTWIFNHVRGSLMPIILLHSSGNAAGTAAVTMFESFPLLAEFIYYGVWWIGAIVILLATGAVNLSRIHERWTNILPSNPTG